MIAPRIAPTSPADIHDLDPQGFLEEVHSFEFWFQAVEGYDRIGRSYLESVERLGFV